jgi:Spy/CpxP family protein refolding chaperone
MGESMRNTALVTVMALAIATPAFAQHQHQDSAQAGGGAGMQMGQHGQDGGMGTGMQARSPMVDMHGGIDAMLRLSGPLELSAEQVTRLEALKAAAAQEAMHHEHMATQSHHAALMAIHHGDIDLAAHEAKLKEAMNHSLMAQMGNATKLAEARQVLTAEQRSKLDFAMEALRAMMGMGHGRNP